MVYFRAFPECEAGEVIGRIFKEFHGITAVASEVAAVLKFDVVGVLRIGYDLESEFLRCAGTGAHDFGGVSVDC